MITFKSIPEMYEKEISGQKNNTVRKLDPQDMRCFELAQIAESSLYDEVEGFKIKIKKSGTEEFFERSIKDVSFWDGIWIITWRC